MSDDLSAPLGKKKPKRVLPKISIDLHQLPFGKILFGVVVLALAIPVARIILVDDPTGGRPVAEVSINSEIDTNPVAQDVSLVPEVQPTIIANNSSINGPQITTIDDGILDPSPDLETAGHLLTDFGVYPDLVEQTQYGVVPRISPLGETPFAAYARASIGPESAGGKPLIAIIVTGLGLNEVGTQNAIADLPENFTLAFAPHGRTLNTTAAQARSDGHELLLEVPMEPFDYPNSDPGPHTLLTNQPARANLDHLTWVMAQMGGYVGLINYQGARFTSSVADLGPIMEELGTRGIGYLDDGSSNRSLTRQLAEANQVPYARASIRLDTNPSRAAILEALKQLENEASQNGGAVGVISALPVSINTLKSWAADLEQRQLLLVPVSALMKANL